MKVAVLGSTGLVGKNVLKILARLEQVVRVYCPVRTVPQLSDVGILQGASKFDFEELDFEQITEPHAADAAGDDAASESSAGVARNSIAKVRAGFLGCDAVICCLGTTHRLAGSKAAFERVDLRLPLALAAVAKSQGVKHFLCISAMGANTKSPYHYNRVKGMLEEGLTMMGFECLTLVRPSLLLGRHKDRRFGEGLLQKAFGRHPEWIPARIRPVYAETVAAHLAASLLTPPVNVKCAADGVVGKRIIYNRILAETRADELL